MQFTLQGLHSWLSQVKYANYHAAMTQQAEGPSDIIGQRIREVRRRRGWSGEVLAQRCQEHGLTLSRQAVANIENGRPSQDGTRRRHVTVEELLGLSLVLGVAPVHLLIPKSNDENYPLTESHAVATEIARNWVRGSTQLPLSDEDTMIWLTERPQQEMRIVSGSENGEGTE